MINRVESPVNCRQDLPEQKLEQAPCPTVAFPDRLLSASKGRAIFRNAVSRFNRFYNWMQRIPFFRVILTILEKLYRFIKYDILFLFNDEEEELKEIYRPQIEEFEEVFHEMFGSNTDEGRKAIRASYHKLETGLQKMIKDDLSDILKLDRPDLSRDEILARRDQVIEDPFKVFDGKEEGDAETNPMARAIYATMRKL